MRFSITALIAIMFCGLAFADNGDTRGYVARACGFDLDDDGIIGEASDCTICDGSTTDPDGDGTAEDINYVQAQTGTNSTTCGASGTPCATIAYVLAGSNSSFANVVNGPADGAEDIICIAGTFTSVNLAANISGVTGNHTNRHSHEYPTDPFMIVGWDTDGDGSYPPFDTDDTAVIDGGGTSNTFIDASDNTSYVEIAHIAVKDIQDTNFFTAGNDLSHWY